MRFIHKFSSEGVGAMIGEEIKMGDSKGKIDRSESTLIILSTLSALFFLIYFFGRYLFLGLGPFSKSSFLAELMMALLLVSGPIVLYKVRNQLNFFDSIENVKRGLSHSDGKGATLLAWFGAALTIFASLSYLYFGLIAPLFGLDSSILNWRLYG